MSEDHLAAVNARLPRTELAPACRQCNSILGNRLFATMAERREYVKCYLRRKYRRYLALPHWDAEELEDLGYSLRQMVRHGQAVKEQARRRLSW